jgi:hypothetical protein
MRRDLPYRFRNIHHYILIFQEQVRNWSFNQKPDLMKRSILFSIAVLLSLTIMAQEKPTDKDMILKTIEKAYVQGLQNGNEIDNILKGFHPGFNLLGMDQNNHLTKFPIYTWYDVVEARIAAGEKPEVETTAKYPLVDITGKAAVVKVELYREGKMIFTDYLSLYKFEEGWRIVSKIYHRM